MRINILIVANANNRVVDGSGTAKAVDSVGAIPEDAFATAEAFRQTGVRTRLLVLDKP